MKTDLFENTGVTVVVIMTHSSIDVVEASLELDAVPVDISDLLTVEDSKIDEMSVVSDALENATSSSLPTFIQFF